MTPDDLVQIRAIEQLKHRYMRAVDTKDWALFASTMAPDVTAVYGKRLKFDSRDELVGELSQRMDNTKITVHHLHQPEIVVDGDTATGTWALYDRVIRKSLNVLLEGAAFYTDEYRRGADGEWLISRTTYERLYEAEFSLDDLPSFTLTADRFAQA